MLEQLYEMAISQGAIERKLTGPSHVQAGWHVSGVSVDRLDWIFDLLSICGKLPRNAHAIYSTLRCNSLGHKPMKLICLDLEINRPKFIEDPTFWVIPDIGDLLDANFSFLDEGNKVRRGTAAAMLGLCCHNRWFGYNFAYNFMDFMKLWGAQGNSQGDY